MATQMQLEAILAGNRIATPSCEAEATKGSMKAKIVSVPVISKVLSVE